MATAGNVFSYYEDMPRLNSLIRNGSVAQIVKLLKRNPRLDVSDNAGNVPLHEAVNSNHLQIMRLLLQSSNINLNQQNFNGDTPILLAVKQNAFDAVKELFQSGGDITIPDHLGMTPLHYSARVSSEIAHFLIQNGADINAQDKDGFAPLHEAATHKNFEFLCMLLYYNADTNVGNNHNLTPLMHAINEGCPQEFQEILLEYTANINVLTCDGFNALSLALNRCSDLAGEILERGGEVNIDTEFTPLTLTLFYDDAILFKKILPLCDSHIIHSGTVPFLKSFIEKCTFSHSEWVECLYILLKSPVASDLVDQYMNRRNEPTLFESLANSFSEKCVEKTDRITIIYIFLSLNADVYFTDVCNVYKIYGFNEEFSIFLDFTVIPNNISIRYLFIHLIFNFTYSNDHFYKMCIDFFLCTSNFSGPNSFQNFFKFFSPMLICDKNYKSTVFQLFEKLMHRPPTVPKLVELSRNKFREALSLKFGDKSSVFYHTYVKMLPLPELIKEIIILKLPLY